MKILYNIGSTNKTRVKTTGFYMYKANFDSLITMFQFGHLFYSINSKYLKSTEICNISTIIFFISAILTTILIVLNKFNCKYILIVSNMAIGISTYLMLSAKNYQNMIWILDCIWGMGVGASLITVPIYISCVATRTFRKLYLSFYGGIGSYLFIYFSLYFCNFEKCCFDNVIKYHSIFSLILGMYMIFSTDCPMPRNISDNGFAGIFDDFNTVFTFLCYNIPIMFNEMLYMQTILFCNKNICSDINNAMQYFISFILGSSLLCNIFGWGILYCLDHKLLYIISAISLIGISIKLCFIECFSEKMFYLVMFISIYICGIQSVAFVLIDTFSIYLIPKVAFIQASMILIGYCISILLWKNNILTNNGLITKVYLNSSLFISVVFLIINYN